MLPIELTFTIVITEDLILKACGVIGVLGLIGMAANSIWQNYKRNYRRPSMIIYRFTDEKK